ncbi:hypothetical protein [Trichormus sp. NMC-1]|uniref:hypothetical protein n=1 Tax=Trichormus sp. NMC-1 TaxID=1853259 RepID=UPI00115FE9FF|nr:hypothetical protein [Trichormus sp. NMC-1]
MAFDVLVTQHLRTFVGLRCRLTQPTKTLNRTVLYHELVPGLAQLNPPLLSPKFMVGYGLPS